MNCDYILLISLRPCILPNLFRPPRSAEYRTNARLIHRPVQHDLGDRLPFLFSGGFELVQEFVVVGPGVGLEEGVFAAGVVGGEVGVFAVLSSEEAFEQGPVGHDRDFLFQAPGNDFLFDVALQHVVAQLYGGEGADFVKALEVFEFQVGGTDGSDLSGGFGVGERLGGVFNRGVWVGAVEVVQVDVIGVETGEAFFQFLLQPFGRAVDLLLFVFPVDASFGGDDDLVAFISESGGDSFFAFAFVAVDIGGVEVVDAGIEGGLQGLQSVFFCDPFGGDSCNGPAAHGDGSDLNSTAADFT